MVILLTSCSVIAFIAVHVKVSKDFNLNVNQRQTVALVGHPGCGKSTCMQLFLRFYDAKEGEFVSLLMSCSVIIVFTKIWALLSGLVLLKI